MTALMAGTIVKITGLTSHTGSKLNEKRAIVIRRVPNQSPERWEVRVESEQSPKATKALKTQNLKPYERLPPPSGCDRGVVEDGPAETTVRKLCELLVYDKDDYRPSEIYFVGIASQKFMKMGPSNFKYFEAIQAQQIGGVLALAEICEQTGATGAANVLFGLLEGDPMYTDVLILTLTSTGLIESENDSKHEEPSSSFKRPSTELTPDQDSESYTQAMAQGPLLLLQEVSKYDFGEALWAATRRSDLYHLLVQRLLRLLARESLGNRDGKRLGKMASRVLSKLICKKIEGPISRQSSIIILESVGTRLASREMVTSESVQSLLADESGDELQASSAPVIEAGTVATIRGLTHDKELNGKRAIVIRRVQHDAEPDQWVVRLEFSEQPKETRMLKTENLTPFDRLPLPTGSRRGIAVVGKIEPEEMPRKVCELLVYYKDNFRPSEISFSGMAAFAFSNMGEPNFVSFESFQIEQIGGVLALAAIIWQGKELACGDVLFGLLEGNEMYLDVFIHTMHWTGRIVEESGGRGFVSCPLTELTPDQDSTPYVKTMAEGPLFILHEISKCSFSEALWAALKRSEFYHLLVQRLLRWTAREALGTRDGKKLGPMARPVLAKMVGVSLEDPLSTKEQAEHILKTASARLVSTRFTTVEQVQKLLDGN